LPEPFSQTNMKNGFIGKLQNQVMVI